MALSHVDGSGRATMVDVSAKSDTDRVAVADGFVSMSAEALEQVRANTAAKGDVLATARLAGIMGGKRTAELIPLCHPLPLDQIHVDAVVDDKRSGVSITATARTRAATGVEMEALTAVSIACLTVYDMVKAVDRTMTIGPIRLLEKRGGKSGVYQRKELDG